MKNCESYIELLSVFADGELVDENDKKSLEAHLLSCDECSALLKLYSEITLTTAETKVDVPDALCIGVMNTIKNEELYKPNTKKTKTKVNMILTRYLPIAACLVVLVLVWQFNEYLVPRGSDMADPEVFGLTNIAGDVQAGGADIVHPAALPDDMEMGDSIGRRYNPEDGEYTYDLFTFGNDLDLDDDNLITQWFAFDIENNTITYDTFILDIEDNIIIYDTIIIDLDILDNTSYRAYTTPESLIYFFTGEELIEFSLIPEITPYFANFWITGDLPDMLLQYTAIPTEDVVIVYLIPSFETKNLIEALKEHPNYSFDLLNEFGKFSLVIFNP
jgi:hypothetical protein